MNDKRWLAVVVLALLAGAGVSFWLTRRLSMRPEHVKAEFAKLYHKLGESTYNDTSWLGTEIQKCPMDLLIFQEILYETKPDVLVEAGTYKGGSAYFFASIFDLMKKGRVITIDIEKYPNLPKHDRITYLLGSSTSDAILQQVRSAIQPGERVIVVLDSDHHRDHVYKELQLYSPLVSPGCYLVVEDTHFNGHPILTGFGPGPFEAVQDFLKDHADFAPDSRRERFLMTFNPGGYLKRLR
jgi:cephalosporin hydroxylase